MSFLTKIWDWLIKAGEWVAENGAKTAVAAIEELQTFFKTGTPGFIASVLDKLTKSGLPTEILNDISAALPGLLAAALNLEQPETAASDAQLAAFEQQVLAKFGVTDDKSKLYTTLSADLLGIIRRHTNPDGTFTFGVNATDVEAEFQALQQDLQTAA